MSNDDLSLEDLTPNILDDWERWALGTHPDSSPGFKQTADHRKIIALVRAVRRLRTLAAEAPAPDCGCGRGAKCGGMTCEGYRAPAAPEDT